LTTIDDVAVYRSDRAVVCCGDSVDVLSLFASGSFDLVATDPPYGVKWQSNFRIERMKEIEGDDDKEIGYVVIKLSLKLLRKNRHIYVFGPFEFDDLPVSSSAELVWSKGNMGMGDLSMPWGPCHERIVFASIRDKANRARGDGRLTARMRQGSVISVDRKNANAVTRHPTEKPVLLMRQLIDSSSNVDEVVLDPFAGSGSTGVAAVLAGRRTVLIEKDEKYAQMSADRVKAAEELYRQMEKI
jgi:DNA modification methylase